MDRIKRLDQEVSGDQFHKKRKIALPFCFKYKSTALSL